VTTIEYKRRRKTNQKHNTMSWTQLCKKTGPYQEHANHDLPCNTKHCVKGATSGSANK
jgi:hypothetical protein